MTQAPIDLLPEAIRQRSQARVRITRFVAASVVALVVLVILAVHARVQVQRGRVQLADAEARAADVLELEAQADELRGLLDEMETFIDRYEQVALPLPVSSILATLINHLPESVTLTQVTIDAVHRRDRRSPRSRGLEEATGPPPRVLTAEVGGFAANDADIAELVERLSITPPMREVSLDFSRTRSVRERLAREFRMSFRVDLDARYELASPLDGDRAGTTAPPPDGREMAHVRP